MNHDEADVPAEMPAHPQVSPADHPPPSPLPRRPRVWTVFVLYVVTMVANLVAAAILLVVLAVWTRGPTLGSPAEMAAAVEHVSVSSLGILSTLLCTAINLTTAATLAAVLSPVPLRERLWLRPAKLSLLAVAVSIFGVLSIGLIFSAMDGLGWLPESRLLKQFAEVVRGMSGLTLVAAMLVIGLGPGIAEEMLFRGYIQSRLRERWGPGLAILCTSLLFGIMHLDPLQGSFAFGMGIFLGYLTERAGTILPAMICHAANNIVSTVTTAADLEIVGAAASLTTLGGSVVVLGISVWYVHRFVKPAEVQPAAGSNVL